jgi:hypothetical protein
MKDIMIPKRYVLPEKAWAAQAFAAKTLALDKAKRTLI